ncbi:MAG: hypothetical protein LIO93_00635 [Bacteroidales bacterium]|nr:hypothetical protein [Bacteroidales bacterium]
MRVPDNTLNIDLLDEKASECIQKIRELPFQDLDISEYNKEYIQRIFPYLEYLFQIYIEAFSKLKTITNKSIIVDFGGGHGFLSLFLKSLGCQVAYCDYNPSSVHTIRTFTKLLGFGPDYIIQGNSKELKAFLKDQNVLPTHLIATDLIEHVYDLNLFFKDLKQLNPRFDMVFTTGSNPSNFLKCFQLRRDMKKEEKKYFAKRKDFIQKNGSGLNDSQIHQLAVLTRGKNYADIQKDITLLINTGDYPTPLTDKYNTCNPETSSWDERILSFDEYRRIINGAGFHVYFSYGYYDHITNGKRILFRILNAILRHAGKSGFFLAPYIILKVEK